MRLADRHIKYDFVFNKDTYRWEIVEIEEKGEEIIRDYIKFMARLP